VRSILLPAGAGNLLVTKPQTKRPVKAAKCKPVLS
jgi:hypothetical protein